MNYETIKLLQNHLDQLREISSLITELEKKQEKILFDMKEKYEAEQHLEIKEILINAY